MDHSRYSDVGSHFFEKWLPTSVVKIGISGILATEIARILELARPFTKDWTSLKTAEVAKSQFCCFADSPFITIQCKI